MKTFFRLEKSYKFAGWDVIQGRLQYLIRSEEDDTFALQHGLEIKISEDRHFGNTRMLDFLAGWIDENDPDSLYQTYGGFSIQHDMPEDTTLFDISGNFLGLPLSTSSQRSNAPNVVSGTITFDTSDHHFYGYNGSSWVVLG